MSGPPPGSALARLSISATDEEWAQAAERAREQEQSVSRYLVDAALAEGRAIEGERGLLEAVRRLRPLLSGGSGGGLSRSGMRERLAVLFAAWAVELAASGRTAELCAVLAPAMGEGTAKRVAAALAEPEKAGNGNGGPRPVPQGELL